MHVVLLKMQTKNLKKIFSKRKLSKRDASQERVRIDMEFVEGLYNEVCNLNLDVKGEITKVIRLGKKQTDGDTGDTEQKPRPLKLEMKDTNKKMELFKRLSNLRDAENKYKSLSIQHDLKKREEGRKLLEEARTKEINDDGKWLYRVRVPPWVRKIVRFKPRRDEE